ncbi:uncharacterized protein SCHCODRAFT_02506491 [Schizophyllum commune H4-8]|nr:uncharacterized protein SCHCODRAFT_02506491 [Schizophyllum commune H4-8]KAI5891862.1 hypothetical protein SCHCODRAFT_02506491 [Schizophyllum commune H4-8]
MRSTRRKLPQWSKDPVQRVNMIQDIAFQLNGNTPWSQGPASNRRDALDKLRVLLEPADAFPGLSDKDNRTKRLAEDDPAIEAITMEIRIFSFACEAVCTLEDGGGDVNDMLYRFWPNAIDWLAFLHPGSDSVYPTKSSSGNYLVLEGLTKAYLYIFQYNRGHMERLLIDRPDMLFFVFDFWLRFPRYIPETMLHPEFNAADTIHTLLNAVSTLYNMVSGWDLPHPQRRSQRNLISVDDARAIFVRELQRHLGKGGLHTFFTKQNEYLAHLFIPPRLVGRVWYMQFELQSLIIRNPAFARDICPRAYLRSIVESTNILLDQRLHRDAIAGADLLGILCQATESNKTLMRALEAGAYSIIKRIGMASEDYNVIEFTHQLCTGLAQASVLRVFHRLHKDEFDPEPTPMDPKRRLNYKTVIRQFSSRYKFYLVEMKSEKHWKQFPCSNDALEYAFVRVAMRSTAPSDVSVSTGRKHTTLRAARTMGRGAYTRPQEIAANILSMHERGKLPVVTFEQSQIYPAVRATVRALEEDSLCASAPRGTVFLEVKINLGRDQPTRMLPFTYTVDFFERVVNNPSWFPKPLDTGGRK